MGVVSLVSQMTADMYHTCNSLEQVGNVRAHARCSAGKVLVTSAVGGLAEEDSEEMGTQAVPSKRVRIDQFFLDKKFLEPPPTKFPIPNRKKGRRPTRAQKGSYRSPGMRELVRPFPAPFSLTEEAPLHPGSLVSSALSSHLLALATPSRA